jgi:hypothetical protein
MLHPTQKLEPQANPARFRNSGGGGNDDDDDGGDDDDD